MTPSTTREQNKRLVARALEILATDAGSVTQAAARCGVSTETMRDRMARGEVDYVKIGRDYWVWRDDA